MRRWGGIAASGLFALILLAGLRSGSRIDRPPKAMSILQTVEAPPSAKNNHSLSSATPDPLPHVLTFDPSMPLLEPLTKELSIAYFGRPPNIIGALRTRWEEAGNALAAILGNPNANRHARGRALRLLSELNFPQAREVLVRAAGDEDLRYDAVKLLGKRAEEGNADVLLNLYQRQSGEPRMNFNAHIVQALSEIGDARAIPLIEELIQTYREVLPKLLSDPEEEIQSNRASIEADFKARIAALQNSREWIVMVNGPDPVTALIPFLYDLNGGWPERAFRALARLDPPTFPAHLRASYDLLKGRSKEFRSGMNTLYEVEVLRALDQRGTPLTPDERRFLSEWDTYEGCVPPTLPD